MSSSASFRGKEKKKEKSLPSNLDRPGRDSLKSDACAGNDMFSGSKDLKETGKGCDISDLPSSRAV